MDHNATRDRHAVIAGTIAGRSRNETALVIPYPAARATTSAPARANARPGRQKLAQALHRARAALLHLVRKAGQSLAYGRAGLAPAYIPRVQTSRYRSSPYGQNDRLVQRRRIA